MNKKILLVILGLVLAGAAIFFFVFRKPAGNIDLSGIILFYGQGCPHCKNVDDYLKQNSIEDKVRFQKLEVFYNSKNADLLGQLAQRCGLNNETIGVPFLWNGASSTCASGDADVINFFKSKIGG
jgi:glutaredoxin